MIHVHLSQIINNFGSTCFELHYHGSTKEDIIKFIEDTIISKEDSLFTKRQQFIESTSIAQDLNVANLMKREMDKLYY